MNELDRVEAAAMRDVVVLGGGRAETVGGALGLRHETLQVPELNRALPLAALDLSAIRRWFGAHPHTVAVPPGYEALVPQLEQAGYTNGYAWMKFEHDAAAPSAVAGTLPIAATLDRALFGSTIAEGFDLPPEAGAQVGGIVGAPGRQCFVAWDGDEAAGAGALYLGGTTAWPGIAGTRPAFRRRGAQGGILAARIAAARTAGAARIATETGERVEGRRSGSYRNILRAGFREAYLRPNWASPA